MSNKKLGAAQLVAAMVLSLTGLTAGAEDLHPSAHLQADSITQKLQDSKRRAALLKAEIEELESELNKASLKSQIKMIQMNSGEIEGSTVNGKNIVIPQVLAIFGANNSLFASLLMENNVRVDVKRGDRLNNNFIVTGVSADRVTLRRDKKDYVLTVFSGVESGKTSRN